MKVISFTKKDVDDAAKKLADAVVIDGIYPDIVVGIRTGGVDVARCIIAELTRKGCHSIFVEVFIQRKSTPMKKKLLSGILPFLPLWLLDGFRIMEAKWLALVPKSNETKCFSFDAGQESVFRLRDKKCCVLVVDDAVDSGATMRSVVDGLKMELNVSQIVTAAITVTTHNSCFHPDYYIFNNETLIRFPWSIDVKKR